MYNSASCSFLDHRGAAAPQTPRSSRGAAAPPGHACLDIGMPGSCELVLNHCVGYGLQETATERCYTFVAVHLSLADPGASHNLGPIPGLMKIIPRPRLIRNPTIRFKTATRCDPQSALQSVICRRSKIVLNSIPDALDQCILQHFSRWL